jgi:hypothetical protein
MAASFVRRRDARATKEKAAEQKADAENAG